MFFIRKKLPKKCDFCTRFLRAEARVCSGAGHDFDRFTSSGWSRRIFYCRVCREPAHMVALGDPWSPDSLRGLKKRDPGSGVAPLIWGGGGESRR